MPGDVAWANTAALELQAAQPAWHDAPPLADAARDIPAVAATTPGNGPDPTNTDAGGLGIHVIATSSAVAG